jgi:hypothetical protein
MLSTVCTRQRFVLRGGKTKGACRWIWREPIAALSTRVGPTHAVIPVPSLLSLPAPLRLYPLLSPRSLHSPSGLQASAVARGHASVCRAGVGCRRASSVRGGGSGRAAQGDVGALGWHLTGRGLCRRRMKGAPPVRLAVRTPPPAGARKRRERGTQLPSRTQLEAGAEARAMAVGVPRWAVGRGPGGV